MCLHHSRLITPEEDITVYKVLVKQTYRNRPENSYEALVKDSYRNTEALNYNGPEAPSHTVFFSPYHGTEWEMGVRKRTTRNEESKAALLESARSTGMIGGGAFHSFRDKCDAQSEACYLKGITSDNLVIAKCIIPKDSLYVFEGYYSNNACYASSDLIVEEVEEPYYLPPFFEIQPTENDILTATKF